MKQKSRFAKPVSKSNKHPAKGPLSFSSRPKSASKPNRPGTSARSSNSSPSHSHGKSSNFSTTGQLWPKAWRAIIGQHAINECLQVYPNHLEELWIKQGFERDSELRELEANAQKLKIKVLVKPEALLAKVGHSHQGAALFCSKSPELDLADLLSKESARVVVLDEIEDPHNLGAIIRTCWLMGVTGILIPQDRAVGLTPSVHKVASGGAEHVPLYRVSNFSSIIKDLKDNGFWIYGLSHRGKMSLYQVDLPAKVVWMVGGEEKGLRTTMEKLCDELVSIPQASPEASFNASVAAAIALGETHRQAQQKNL